MKPRFVVWAFCVLVCASQLAFARDTPWFKQPGTPMTLESSGFVFRATLPHGWTFTADDGIVPPPAFASACRVRGEFYTDREWHRVLAPALRTRTVEGKRFVYKIGGHEALSNRHTREDTAFRDIYINLSELQPDSAAVWSFEGSPGKEGLDCERQFIALVNSATITRAAAQL